jgi:pimeloyl-ACP methyl ester carboxylesterase
MSGRRQHEIGFAAVEGGQLFYEVAGEGPPLVLIHAGIADSRMWDDQLDTFAARFTTVRYDVRGFGRSDLPTGDYANHDDLGGLFGQIGLERAALVGVSMGAEIAAEFALTYPERVTALVLVASRLARPTASEALRRGWDDVEAAYEAGDIPLAVELELRMWVDGPRRSPDQIDPAVRERVRVMDTDLFRRGEGAGDARPLEPPASARLAEIRAPTLIIAGDHDVADVVESIDQLVASIPGARQAIVPGTAHLPSMERPNEFNRIVLDFLGSLGHHAGRARAR